jgi:8-oxo-dGTP pyrophosphatase MutT (NUDIX family)
MGDNDRRLTLRTRLTGSVVRGFGLLTRSMTLGVRALVIDREGRVFLVRHTYVKGWYLPGGGVERGETVLQSLVRELEEEGAIRLTGEPELRGLCLNTARDHVALYVVRAFAQDAPKAPDMEIAETGFFAPDALPEGATPATRARIAEILGGAAQSSRW